MVVIPRHGLLIMIALVECGETNTSITLSRPEQRRSETTTHETRCPSDDWHAPFQCSALLKVSVPTEEPERLNILDACKATHTHFASYVDAYTHWHLQAAAFREEALRLLQSNAFAECPACVALLERDLGLSYEREEPMDYALAAMHLRAGCIASFRTSASALLSACDFLDTSDNSNRHLKLEHSRFVEGCGRNDPRTIGQTWPLR
jgi:hypothetical protein